MPIPLIIDNHTPRLGHVRPHLHPFTFPKPPGLLGQRWQLVAGLQPCGNSDYPWQQDPGLWLTKGGLRVISVWISQTLFFRQAENGGRDVPKVWRNLSPHFVSLPGSCQNTSRAFQANSREFEELLLTREEARSPGSRSAKPLLYLGSEEG